MKKLALVALVAASTSVYAAGRDTINIVGSSTVYPFATVVAENFGKSTDFNTPKIESTGSGGGLKLFCEGVGVERPDITNASRRIKKSEIEKCASNGVTDIVEVLIGFDGIAFANSLSGKKLSITRKDLFLALASEIPNPDGSESWVANPYTKWNEVNSDLPAIDIEVLGPPPSSGTRDAFAELVMEGGCKKFDWVKALKKSDKKSYKKHCHAIREDGKYVEAGENDNLIVQKLEKNPNAFGIFGYSFLEQNADKVQGAEVDGVAPGFEAIADGSYPVSRPLYFYVKKAHIGVVPGIKEYLEFFVSEDAIGDEGYLLDKGLIPLANDKREAVRNAATNLENVSL